MSTSDHHDNSDNNHDYSGNNNHDYSDNNNHDQESFLLIPDHITPEENDNVSCISVIDGESLLQTPETCVHETTTEVGSCSSAVPQEHLAVLDIDTVQRSKEIPSAVDEIEASCKGRKKRRVLTTQEKDELNSTDKKAIGFPILSLEIGTWKKKTRHGGDLKAKCYFKKKRKLAWEGLQGNLKRKIEFEFSDIFAMRDRYQDKEGILDILLKNRPKFYLEVDPVPKKHTNWRKTKDFSDGEQASTIRRHKLIFKPEVLKKHYDRIVQADPELHAISQREFPSTPSLYFDNIPQRSQHQLSPNCIPPQQNQIRFGLSSLMPARNTFSYPRNNHIDFSHPTGSYQDRSYLAATQNAVIHRNLDQATTSLNVNKRPRFHPGTEDHLSPSTSPAFFGHCPLIATPSPAVRSGDMSACLHSPVNLDNSANGYLQHATASPAVPGTVNWYPHPLMNGQSFAAQRFPLNNMMPPDYVQNQYETGETSNVHPLDSTYDVHHQSRQFDYEGL